MSKNHILSGHFFGQNRVNFSIYAVTLSAHFHKNSQYICTFFAFFSFFFCCLKALILLAIRRYVVLNI